MLRLSIKSITTCVIISSILIIGMTQYSSASPQSLDLVVYSDGSTHVSSQMDVDPLAPNTMMNLFGIYIDNFIVVDERGFLLPSEITDDKATIDTLGSSSITINYDVHDLVHMNGRDWTFSLDSPYDYNLLFPENSVIVGMNKLPNNMKSVNEQTKLELSSGFSEFNYIFGNHRTTAPLFVAASPSINTSTIGETNLTLEYLIIFALVLTLVSIMAVSIKKSNRYLSRRIKLDTITNMSKKWDVFISCASEDKVKIAKPLAERLQSEGFEVWFDEWQLKIGTDLRKSIKEGIDKSYFGIVILSETFFKKEGTRLELDDLISIMTNTPHECNLFPILHGISHEEISSLFPILANIVSRSWEDDGMDKIVKELVDVMLENSEQLV